VNLRGQGAITGTAPIDVQVNAVRVGGILSPLISIIRAVLDPGAEASVCIEVQNLLGLDLTFLGVEVDITAFNADAPNGVSGRVVVRSSHAPTRSCCRRRRTPALISASRIRINNRVRTSC
jgi:hypothetical protein